MAEEAASGAPKAPPKRARGWRWHPVVRSGDQLSLGERAADAMRKSMGSWPFVFGALVFLAVWMASNGRHGFDPFPFILLNLVLSCLAAMQGAILLIAAKRSDQIASELAQHDYDTDTSARQRIEQLGRDLDALSQQHAELHRMSAELLAMVAALTERQPSDPPPGPG